MGISVSQGLSDFSGLARNQGLTGGNGLADNGSSGPTFTPALLLNTFNLAWYDANDASTITIATGVSQWNDKSGNARNLTQGTGGSQPTYDAVNKKVTFNGSSQYLFNSSPFMYANNQIAIYAVVNVTGVNGATLIGEGSSASGNPVYQFGNKNASPNSDVAGFLRNDALTTAVSSVNGFGVTAFNATKKLVRILDSGSVMNSYVNGSNGTAAVAYTRSGVLTINRFSLGCLLRTTPSQYATGDVHEIVICTNDTYGLILEGYLAWKWGLQADLPSWHPYKSSAPPPNAAPVSPTLVSSALTAAMMGDSISAYQQAGATGTTDVMGNVGYFATYNALAGNRMKFPVANNLGVAGNTTAQMVSRMATDFGAITFDVCFLLAGTNDIVALQAPPSVTIANLNQIADYVCLNLGKRLIFQTITARSSWGSLTAPQIVTAKDTMTTINTWIMAQNGTRLGRCVSVDAFAATTDGSGGIVSNMAYDGLHLAGYGAMAVGVKNKAIIGDVYYTNNTIDYSTGNLLANGLMTGTGGAAVAPVTGDVADNFLVTSLFSAGSARTASKTGGGAQRLVQSITGGTSTDYIAIASSITTGFSVGDTVYAVGEIEVIGAAVNINILQLELKLTGTGAPTKANCIGFWPNGNSGSTLPIAENYLSPGKYTIATTDLSIASGTGLTLVWQLTIAGDSTTSSAITVDITKAGIFKRI